MANLERETRQQQIAALTEELEALRTQWEGALDDSQRIQIQRAIDRKLKQIEELENRSIPLTDGGNDKKTKTITELHRAWQTIKQCVSGNPSFAIFTLGVLTTFSFIFFAVVPKSGVPNPPEPLSKPILPKLYNTPNSGFLSSQPSQEVTRELSAIKHVEMGIEKQKKQNIHEAIIEFTEAIRLDPNFPEAYGNRGVAKTEIGDNQGAVEDLTKSILINPKIPEAYFYRANARSNLKEYQGALIDYSEAIRLKPDYPEVYNNRAFTKKALGDNHGALFDYTEAIRLKPDSAVTYMNRGKIKNILGDNQGSILDFREAAHLYQKQGDFTNYQNMLELIQQLGG